MKSRVGLTLLILVIVLLGASLSTAVQNKGASEITLDGGSRGKIEFPHSLHQDTLGDCNACHDLFPQESGSIKRLKNQKKLKKKQVMNDNCRACHKTKKKANQATGPTTCAGCHRKK